jgi:hypothetical protein
VIESIGSAAAKFAFQYASRQLLDRRKHQDLVKAYRGVQKRLLTFAYRKDIQPGPWYGTVL